MKKSPTRFIRRVDNKFTSASLDLNFQNMTPSSFDSRITFTRASSGTYFDGSGILQTASTNVPRLDHNPTTLQSLGLLIEEQRTNLWVRSDDFANASWSKVRGSISSNVIIAPDGTLTGDKFSPNTDANTHLFRQDVSVTSGTTYTWTIYAKAGEINSIQLEFGTDNSAFSLTSSTFTLTGNGTATSSGSITLVGNGWYRCSLSAAATATATGVMRHYVGGSSAGNDFNGIFVWGAQLEVGSFPTSYIPTGVATATRNADAATMTGTNFSSWYNATEGTFYAEVAPIAIEAGKSILGSNLNNYNPLFFGSSSTLDVDFRNVGGLLSSIGTSVTAINFKATVAASITGSVAGSFNAALTSISMSALDFSTVNILRIGNRNTGSVFNGRIKRIAYWGVRLDNSKLQALTT